MNKEDLAKKYFYDGYNCGQALVLAFSDSIDINKEDLVKLTSNLGGGVARLRETCGCVSALALIIGYIYGKDRNDIESKSMNYQMVQDLALEFKKEFGSYICSELLNIKDKPSNTKMVKRDKSYYESRPCANYIGYMARLIERKINGK